MYTQQGGGAGAADDCTLTPRTLHPWGRLAITVLALAVSACASSSTDDVGSGGQPTTSSTGGAGGAAGGSGGSGGTGTGGGATGGSAGAGGEPACPSLGDACTGCLATSCSDEYCACFDNIACVQVASCLQTCAANDAVCAQNCWTQYPNGISDVFILGGCGSTNCPGSCAFGLAIDACQQCMFSQCGAQMNTCLSAPACTAIIEAIRINCAPPNNTLACQDGYIGNDSKALAVRTCQQANCAVECPVQ